MHPLFSRDRRATCGRRNRALGKAAEPSVSWPGCPARWNSLEIRSIAGSAHSNPAARSACNDSVIAWTAAEAQSSIFSGWAQRRRTSSRRPLVTGNRIRLGRVASIQPQGPLALGNRAVEEKPPLPVFPRTLPFPGFPLRQPELSK